MINIMIKQPPKVVNIQFNEYDVFIGRPSKWGNPFKIGEGKYTREQALEKFDEWIVGQADLLDDIEELRGKILGCYCKPERCHGDTLLQIANS